MASIREILNQAGLTEQKWRILHTLEKNGRLEQTAIAEKVGPASRPSGRTHGIEDQIGAQPFKEKAAALPCEVTELRLKSKTIENQFFSLGNRGTRALTKSSMSN